MVNNIGTKIHPWQTPLVAEIDFVKFIVILYVLYRSQTIKLLPDQQPPKVSNAEEVFQFSSALMVRKTTKLL